MVGGGSRFWPRPPARETPRPRPRISLARSDLREQPGDDLVIHRRPHRQDADLAVRQAITILRRHRGPAHETAARILDEVVEKELRRLLHHRIRAREERAIGLEQVVLPQMLREPRGAGRPQPRARQIAGRREAPDVGDVMRDEPARAVVHARGLAAGLAQRIEKLKQRLVQLGKVGHLRRPVVHLQIDVEVIVGVPRRAHAVVPHALQIRGKIARPAAGDQQVAAELEVQRVEHRIRAPRFTASRRSSVG